MAKPPTNYRFTLLSTEDEVRVVTCAQCTKTAVLRACWDWDGRTRHWFVCAEHAARFAERHGLTLPGKDAPRPAPVPVARLARPTLPQRKERARTAADILTAAVSRAESMAKSAKAAARTKALPPEDVEERITRTIQLIASGTSDTDIARLLGIGERALRHWTGRVLRNYDARSKAHAVHQAHRAGELCGGGCAPTPVDVRSRSREVLAELAAGATTEEMAAGLNIAVSTVKDCIKELGRELGYGGRAHIVHQAHRHGLLACACTTQSGRDSIAQRSTVEVSR